MDNVTEKADLKASLASVKEGAHAQFSRNRGRLVQLDSVLATADMILDALAEEEIRHADLAKRVVEDEDAAEKSRHQLNLLHPEYKVKVS